MYPKVKVREQQEYDDHYDFETRSLQSLKALESLSLDDFSSDDSPTSVVRVPRLDSSNSVTPPISMHKEAKRNRKQKVLEENTTNIQASPVPRPRAVLSSPDNDGKIVSKSKRTEDLLSGLKSHNHCPNRHIQCKVIPKPIAADVSLASRRELKDVVDTKRDLRAARQRKVAFDPSLEVSLTNGKPKSAQTRSFSSSTMDK